MLTRQHQRLQELKNQSENQKRPIPLQEPDLIEAFTQENKNITTRWIIAQLIADQPSQAVYPIAHVSQAAIQEVPTTIR